MAKVRALFDAGERLTARDVEQRVHVCLRNAAEYLKLLHDDGAIRICEYRRDFARGRMVPVFELKASDDQLDAPRPGAAGARRRQHAASDHRDANISV